MASEAVDAALHGMPAAVVDRVEGGRPAATAATPAPVTGMVSRLGNGAGDLAPPQVGADGAGGIRLVGADPLRPGPGSATIRPGDADTGHHRLEVRGIPGLPGAQNQRQGPLPVLRPSAVWSTARRGSGPARVIARLRCAPAGRLALGIRLPTGAGGVLMRAHDGGIHTHLPVDQPRRIGPGLQRGQDARPDSVALPAPEQRVDRLPGAVARGHVPPRRADPHPPSDAVDELPLGPLRGPTRPPGSSNKRLQGRHCASVKSNGRVTARVATRSPVSGSSWSMNPYRRPHSFPVRTRRRSAHFETRPRPARPAGGRRSGSRLRRWRR